MDSGDLVDYGHMNAELPTTWKSKEMVPQHRSTLGWLLFNTQAERPAEKYVVSTFRCPECGLLESYAITLLE